VRILRSTLWRRPTVALVVALSVGAISACGSSDTTDTNTNATKAGGGASAGSATESNERDSARVRLIRCLREQGLDVPYDIGQGAEAPDLDRDELEAALEGPCARYRADAFGDSAESGESAAQEKLDKYAQCMRDAGFDFPDVELGNGPPLALHEIDTTDPDFQKADAKCADLRVTPADVMRG
jgi:hypothetical protein